MLHASPTPLPVGQTRRTLASNQQRCVGYQRLIEPRNERGGVCQVCHPGGERVPSEEWRFGSGTVMSFGQV